MKVRYTVNSTLEVELSEEDLEEIRDGEDLSEEDILDRLRDDAAASDIVDEGLTDVEVEVVK